MIMNGIAAHGRRLELRDPVNNNEKFYRIFTVAGLDYTLLNFGRIGVDGMWQIKSGQGFADRQYREKQGGGYQSVLPGNIAVLDFEIPRHLADDLGADLTRKVGLAPHSPMPSYKRLVSAFVSNMGVYGKVEVVRKTDKEEAADTLAALLAKRDKYRKILNPEAAEEPQEPTEPEVPAIDPNSMQGRLADALARAKVKA